MSSLIINTSGFSRFAKGVRLSTLFFTLILLASCHTSEIRNVQLQNGEVGLLNVNFEEEIIQLSGEANFISQEYIEPQSVDSVVWTEIMTTNSWNNQPKEYISYPVTGYGSYYFKVVIPEKYIGAEFILRPNHFIAYASQTFVNGKQVSYNGSVGSSAADTNYNPKRNTVSNSFVVQSQQLDIVIWVANFTHFRGGIFKELSFGTAENMVMERERAVTLDLVVVISLLIMFTYHVVMYFVNRNMKPGLYFGLACLVFAIDLSLQDTMTLFLLFPNISFLLASKLQLVAPFLFPVTFAYFTHILYPEEFSATIKRITLVIAVVLTFATLFFNVNIYTSLVKFNYAYALLVIVYIYIVVFKAVKNNRDGARLFLLAYLIFSICAVNDILYVFEIIHTTNMVSAGLIIFVFLLSILQGRRTAIMHSQTVQLSSQLQELNLNLEEKVKERTLELGKTNEKLSRLLSFKESITSTIVHDLKNPLNAIVNSDLVVNHKERFKVIKQSGYTMLNLVKNILDVYKGDDVNIKPDILKITLSDLVYSAIAEVEFSASLKDLKINHGILPSCSVCLDKELINRVLVNILSNAVKYSPENKEIDIRVTQLEKTLKVEVVNYGPHIPKEIQEHIFTMYGRSDEKNSEWHSSGLGLAFCKMAVEAHNGSIGVNSEPGREVSFWFLLPDVICDNIPQTSEKEESVVVKEVNLTDADALFLRPFIEQIKHLEIYEVSSIRQVIRQIETKSDAINNWKEQVEKAIFSGDAEQLDRLLTL